MATTTPNFGWNVPTSSDLVKNGATDIETLGDSIDTSMGDLLGGTTGQVLAKTSNTDMDFTWTTPSSGALKLITRATYSAVANTGTTFDSVFSNTYKTYLIAIENSFAVTAANDMYMQLRYAGPTTQAATYIWTNDMYNMATAANTTASGNGTNQWQLADDSATTAERFSGQYWLTNAETTTRTQMIGQGLQGNTGLAYNFYGYQFTNRTYTGFILSSSSSNISGTVAVYGLATS
jgi:hypothetical protein